MKNAIKKNKDKNASIRLSVDDYEKIEKYAKCMGMSISEFIRFSTLAAVDSKYVPQAELLKLCHQLECYREIQNNAKIMEYLKGVKRKWL